MEKDTRLVNIYLKIHNKQPLMMDDLAYLAEYAPECFEKTCQNVVYNSPETRPIMETAAPEVTKDEPQPELVNQPNIESVLENLKRLEMNDFPVADIDVDKVKSLLGSLYMELMFPHNDKETFINMANNEKSSLFDKKI